MIQLIVGLLSLLPLISKLVTIAFLGMRDLISWFQSTATDIDTDKTAFTLMLNSVLEAAVEGGQ